MQLENQIRAYVNENLLFNDADYDNDTSFLRAGILDSSGVMELVAFVESTFGISVSPREITPANFDGVNKIAGFVTKKLAAPEG
jgi:acyl carrier protein